VRVDLNGPALGEVNSSEAGKNTEVPVGQAATALQEDTASFSTGHATIADLSVQALSSPEVRQQKVEALRNAIQSGEYQIDPGAIADNMIQELQ
jgi:flagellar biosynthesis anti-sigma factor FlgM